MKINEFKRSLGRYRSNIRGWRTKRKIVVIESDDWGSIRMPSKEVYERCLNSGYPVNLNPYERYDSLVSEEDLEMLFELLLSYKDSLGNHPVITANCVVANPDFRKIELSQFKQYEYELIKQTFESYPKHSRNLDYWKIGFQNKIFYPQFHAREHLNVSKFMEGLQKGNEDVLFAFNNRMPGSILKGSTNSGNDYVEATLYSDPQDKLDKLNIFLNGLDIFETIFGYKSFSVIPPNYIWSDSFNSHIAAKGVRYIQGTRIMREPNYQGFNYNDRYLGKVNGQNQVALVRNCAFEPSIYPASFKNVEQCLSDIEIAFRMHKPAIISSHRINFVGYIDKANRDKTLFGLRELLNRIKVKWPEIEFMSSPQLGELIENQHNII